MTIELLGVGTASPLLSISRSESVRFRLAASASLASGLLLHAVRIGFGVLFYR